MARLPTVWTVVSVWICDRSRPFCVMSSLLSSVWSTWLWCVWYLLKISHYHVLPVIGLVKVWSPRSIYFWLAFRLFMTIVALCNVTTHIMLYKTTRLSSSGVHLVPGNWKKYSGHPAVHSAPCAAFASEVNLAIDCYIFIWLIK